MCVQGLAFWKVPSRKLYAVIPRKRKTTVEILSSDSDDDLVRPKRMKAKQNDNTLVVEAVQEMKSTLNDIMAITKDSKLPLGLKKALHDSFKCTICTVIPIRPPIIVTKCCKSILGCEACVNSWFSGEDALVKTCPKCRAERGYNEIMILRGLDNFLEAVKKLEGDD